MNYRGITLCVLTLIATLLGLSAQALGRQPDNVVTLTAKPSKDKVVPGDQFGIAVILDHEPGWHVQTDSPVIPPEMAGFEAIPTTIKTTLPAGSLIWQTQWPKPTNVEVNFGKPAMFGVFAGRAIAYVPIQVPLSAQAGTNFTAKVAVHYQACNDKTCRLDQTDELEVQVPIVALGTAPSLSPAGPDFGGFDATAFGKPPLSGSQGAKPVKFSAFGWTFSINADGIGLLLLLLVAAFGGLLLNFTPCVLPVIPIKIMGLSQSAGNPARCLWLGTVTSLGVVAFWMAIGGAIAFISGFTAISSLFQTPWFSLSVGVFIFVMGVGMLGAFAVRLPQFVYLINPSHETAGGSFLFGIMTAVLSTPCTAPFMGSAAAWAATQHSSITLITFGAIGFGMALPYLVLSAFPGLVGRMPRTGPASELIKQVMGLLMIAVAVFFLGTGTDPLLRLPVDPPIRFYWWIVAALGVGAMSWLMVRTFQITRRPVPRGFWTVFGVVFSLATILIVRSVTDRGPIPWIGYTPERLAEQLAKKKTVVLDFTAEWCLTCKAQEAAVLHRAEIVKLLTSPGVVPMRVDLTGNNGPGKAKLKELGWVGIPLLVVYGPSLTEPIKYDAYTVDMVKDAIARASGAAAPLTAPAIIPTGSPGAPPTSPASGAGPSSR